MNNKFKKILILGAIISAPLILMSVLSYAFDLNGKIYNWLVILLYALTIFFVQRNFRDNFYNGYASYGKLFGNTFLMICISSLINGIFIYILYKFIAPEQISVMLENARAILYENEMLSEDQVEMAFDMNKKIMTPMFLAGSSLFGHIFQGTIIDLITSAINMKKGDSYEEAMKQISEEE